MCLITKHFRTLFYRDIHTEISPSNMLYLRLRFYGILNKIESFTLVYCQYIRLVITYGILFKVFILFKHLFTIWFIWKNYLNFKSLVITPMKIYRKISMKSQLITMYLIPIFLYRRRKIQWKIFLAVSNLLRVMSFLWWLSISIGDEDEQREDADYTPQTSKRTK